jgi:hypothetical protein
VKHHDDLMRRAETGRVLLGILSNAPWDWQEETVRTIENRIGNLTPEVYFVVIKLTSFDNWKYKLLARLFYTATENSLNHGG